MNPEENIVKRSGLLAAVAAAALFTMPALAADSTGKDDTSAMPAPVEGVDTNAPLEGANSFTEAQVTSRLQENGFTEVSGLKLDDKGIWRGKAKMNNTVYDVAVDYRGNIVYGGTIMAKPE
ncbi:hypothetical protein sos41_27340 [Alphaproteobacteria bacterium SO-S41]|nr:hypothetical protein sos41_27340 [Alphaproteobacteria bacterium SO-S41]